MIKNTNLEPDSFLTCITNFQALQRVIFILFASLLLISSSALAQKPKVKNDPTHDDKPIHFGFSLGLNFMDYGIEMSDTEDVQYVGLKEVKPGINIHAIANLRLASFLDLRALPGISFGERQIHFQDKAGDLMYDGSFYPMQSSYLELPILLKYKALRINNFSPYLIGGINTRYDLSVKKEYDYKDQLIMIQPFQLYSEVGVGFDMYMVYFKLSLELKYSIGISNIFSETDRTGNPPDQQDAIYTNAIDKINSHIFTISFHFE